MRLPSRRSTLFPYTTLFRSNRRRLPTCRHATLVKSPARLQSPKRLKTRSEEHTSELQSRLHLVCRHLLAKKHSRLDNAGPEGDYSIFDECPFLQAISKTPIS